MVATFTHADVEKWMFITCTGTAEGRYPKDAEGDNIGLAIENDFIAETGLAVNTGTAKHMQLCKMLCEKNYRIWGQNKFFGGQSAGTPGGTASFTPNAFSFTQEQYDALVEEIIGGTTTSASCEMVDAETNADGLPNF